MQRPGPFEGPSGGMLKRGGSFGWCVIEWKQQGTPVLAALNHLGFKRSQIHQRCLSDLSTLAQPAA